MQLDLLLETSKPRFSTPTATLLAGKVPAPMLRSTLARSRPTGADREDGTSHAGHTNDRDRTRTRSGFHQFQRSRTLFAQRFSCFLQHQKPLARRS